MNPPGRLTSRPTYTTCFQPPPLDSKLSGLSALRKADGSECAVLLMDGRHSCLIPPHRLGVVSKSDAVFPIQRFLPRQSDSLRFPLRPRLKKSVLVGSDATPVTSTVCSIRIQPAHAAAAFEFFESDWVVSIAVHRPAAVR